MVAVEYAKHNLAMLLRASEFCTVPLHDSLTSRWVHADDDCDNTAHVRLECVYGGRYGQENK